MIFAIWSLVTSLISIILTTIAARRSESKRVPA